MRDELECDWECDSDLSRIRRYYKTTIPAPPPASHPPNWGEVPTRIFTIPPARRRFP